MTRDILNYLGEVVGQLELPDGTSEEVWAEKLAPYARSPEDQTQIKINWLIKDRKQFAEEMMERFKNRNINGGMSVVKALWLHHRMRAWDVTLPPAMGGFTYVVDILNMAVSGDLETAYFALRYGNLDAMDQPYHCIDQTTVDWLKNELSNYLGFNLG
jgi:hypothetical protein